MIDNLPWIVSIVWYCLVVVLLVANIVHGDVKLGKHLLRLGVLVPVGAIIVCLLAEAWVESMLVFMILGYEVGWIKPNGGRP